MTQEKSQRTVRGDLVFDIKYTDGATMLEVFKGGKFIANYPCTTSKEAWDLMDAHTNDNRTDNIVPGFGSYRKAAEILQMIRLDALAKDKYVVTKRVRALDAAIKAIADACDLECKIFEDANADGNAQLDGPIC